MAPVFNHFLSWAVPLGYAVYISVYLYRVWPRKKHLRQGFKKLTPEGVPVEQTSDYVEFRTRLMLCLFFSFALCIVLGFLFQKAFPAPAPAVAADPAPAPPPPRIPRSSTARSGDIIQIVCGRGDFCALAATDQDALKIDTGQIPSGKVTYVKNGTKAIVMDYDPQDTGSDTGTVSILAGADATSITLTARTDPEEEGYIPGRWLHKSSTRQPVTVYQLPSKKNALNNLKDDTALPVPPSFTHPSP